MVECLFSFDGWDIEQSTNPSFGKINIWAAHTTCSGEHAEKYDPALGRYSWIFEDDGPPMCIVCEQSVPSEIQALLQLLEAGGA